MNPSCEWRNGGFVKGFLLIILVGAVLVTGAYPQDFTFSQFVADTLVISLPADSTLTVAGTSVPVLDSRETPGPVLGIRQIKKWKYIPVDQYPAHRTGFNRTYLHLPRHS